MLDQRKALCRETRGGNRGRASRRRINGFRQETAVIFSER